MQHDSTSSRPTPIAIIVSSASIRQWGTGETIELFISTGSAVISCVARGRHFWNIGGRRHGCYQCNRTRPVLHYRQCRCMRSRRSARMNYIAVNVSSANNVYDLTLLSVAEYDFDEHFSQGKPDDNFSKNRKPTTRKQTVLNWRQTNSALDSDPL